MSPFVWALRWRNLNEYLGRLNTQEMIWKWLSQTDESPNHLNCLARSGYWDLKPNMFFSDVKFADFSLVRKSVSWFTDDKLAHNSTWTQELAWCTWSPRISSGPLHRESRRVSTRFAGKVIYDVFTFLMFAALASVCHVKIWSQFTPCSKVPHFAKGNSWSTTIKLEDSFGGR